VSDYHVTKRVKCWNRQCDLHSFNNYHFNMWLL